MERHSVLTTGFVALDVIWLHGRGHVEFAAGGSCGNVSATLAAFGHDVQLAARLGTDPEAAFVIADLSQVGVNMASTRADSSVSTPVVIHEVLHGADHRFVLNNPETGLPLPRYSAIERADIDEIIAGVPPRLFYFDRLSPTIIELARWAKLAGAITFFEPSDVPPNVPLTEVEPFVDILKVSSQRAHEFIHRLRFSSPVQILTDGHRGLDVRMGGHEDPEHHHLAAVPPAKLTDTAGSGDAVSSAVIATILEAWTGELPTPDLILHGLRLGQRLAALNCAFPGARGALTRLGATDVLQHLGRGAELASVQHAAYEPIQPSFASSTTFTSSHALEHRYACRFLTR